MSRYLWGAGFFCCEWGGLSNFGGFWGMADITDKTADIIVKMADITDKTANIIHEMAHIFKKTAHKK